MLRLNFLEDLKRSFEVLAELCQGELRAEWNPKGWIFTDDGGPIEPSDQWIVTGCDYPHVRSLFRLARRGALALGFLEKHNSSAYWLEQLRLKYLYCGFEEITAKSNIRLSDKRHELIRFPGTVIANVCRASIELCEELILDSIQEDLTSAALGRPAATIEDVVRKTTGSTLLLEAKVNAIGSEFSANRKIGVSAHRATARALLQVFDALIENVIMGNNDQGWDLTKEKLESDIPRRAFAIAANQEWVSKGDRSRTVWKISPVDVAF